MRIEFHGARYHVMNRGERREPIFRGDSDRELFLEYLEQVCAKTAWKIHAYCLMPNHFHLALKTPQPNLVSGMRWFLCTYTIRFNARHRLRGHLFSGGYKALIKQWREAESRAYGPIRRGWFLGDKEARQEFLRRHLPSQGRNESGGIWKEVAEVAAEAIVSKELAAAKWPEEKLAQELKRHPVKVRLARRLREKTTMTTRWIAERLKMGTVSYAYTLLNGKEGDPNQ